MSSGLLTKVKRTSVKSALTTSSSIWMLTYTCSGETFLKSVSREIFVRCEKLWRAPLSATGSTRSSVSPSSTSGAAATVAVSGCIVMPVTSNPSATLPLTASAILFDTGSSFFG